MPSIYGGGIMVKDMEQDDAERVANILDPISPGRMYQFLLKAHQLSQRETFKEKVEKQEFPYHIFNE